MSLTYKQIKNLNLSKIENPLIIDKEKKEKNKKIESKKTAFTAKFTLLFRDLVTEAEKNGLEIYIPSSKFQVIKDSFKSKELLTASGELTVGLFFTTLGITGTILSWVGAPATGGASLAGNIITLIATAGGLYATATGGYKIVKIILDIHKKDQDENKNTVINQKIYNNIEIFNKYIAEHLDNLSKSLTFVLQDKLSHMASINEVEKFAKVGIQRIMAKICKDTMNDPDFALPNNLTDYFVKAIADKSISEGNDVKIQFINLHKQTEVNAADIYKKAKIKTLIDSMPKPEIITTKQEIITIPKNHDLTLAPSQHKPMLSLLDSFKNKQKNEVDNLKKSESHLSTESNFTLSGWHSIFCDGNGPLDNDWSSQMNKTSSPISDVHSENELDCETTILLFADKENNSPSTSYNTKANSSPRIFI